MGNNSKTNLNATYQIKNYLFFVDNLFLTASKFIMYSRTSKYLLKSYRQQYTEHTTDFPCAMLVYKIKVHLGMC